MLRHPERQAIFVGDFIDRGPTQVRSVDTVRRMVDAGVALAVMGSHEFNAIAWQTPNLRCPGEYLRQHYSSKRGGQNRRQHAAFLAEVEHRPSLHADIIEWFPTLPLWLDLPDLQVVQACWHPAFMNWLSPRLHNGRYPSRRSGRLAIGRRDKAAIPKRGRRRFQSSLSARRRNSSGTERPARDADP